MVAATRQNLATAAAPGLFNATTLGRDCLWQFQLRQAQLRSSGPCFPWQLVPVRWRARLAEPNPEGSALALLLPERGERTLSIGQTGSGKTSFNVWLLDRLPRAPTVIYDTKEEPKFLTLPASTVTNSAAETTEAIDRAEHDYVIFRPPDHLLDDPSSLDEYLYFHYKTFPGVDAYIDEVYSFHSGGRSFKGLHALLSRGRSKGISTLMSTQRPVFLSRFALTEAQHLYVFSLVHDDDRKTLNKMIPGFESKNLLKPKSHQFFHYNVGEQKLRLYDPVKLTDAQNTGYTDDQLPGLEPDAVKVRRLVWI